MARKYTVIVVPETHWDREWYATFQQFRMRLVRLTDKLLGILDADPNYKSFTFDGQTVVIEDYLEIRPENRRRIAAYAKQGRLLLGPWYVLPDEFLVSGEALVRNLMVGHAIASEFGRVMKAGYIPDPFGHIAQLPQILAGFGIGSALFMRGLGEQGEKLRNEFWWHAPDGTRVLAVHLLSGYCNFSDWGYERTPSGRSLNLDLAVTRARREVDRHGPKAATRYILANNGCDHVEPQPELPAIIEHVNRTLDDAEFVHGSYEDFVAAVLAEQPELGSLTGELHEGKYHPVLSGTFSARMYLKQANERTQTLLERWAEPVSALAWLWGKPYDAAFLWHAWKLCLKNHPHDSICGCSIDQVHREMLPRFEQAQQIGEELTRGGLDFIARRIDTRADPGHREARALVTFNPLGWAWSGVAVAKMELPTPPGRLPDSYVVRDAAGAEVPCQICNDRISEPRSGFPPGLNVREFDLCFLADDVPGLGYKTYLAEPGRPACAVTDLSVGSDWMENSRVTVHINADGTVDISGKESGGYFYNCNAFESTEDVGDEYDYSHSLRSETFTTAGAAARISLVERGPLRATFRIELDFVLPARIAEDRVRRSAERVTCPITTYVTLTCGSPRVDFRTIVDNRAQDHRLRALFPTELQAGSSDAEAQFCTVARPLEVTPMPGWSQQPAPTQVQHSFVDVSDGETGLAIINQGLPEYEVRRDAEGAAICLTLLRCVGWLSRDDYPTRPYNAGPQLPTPDAQCLGVHEFRYAALPHRGTWITGRAWQPAHSHNAPPRVVITDQHEGDQPGRLSFVAIDNPSIALSAVKQAERGDALVVRVYNATNEPAKGKLVVGSALAGWRPVNLNEEALAGSRRRSAAGGVRLALRPFEIATVELYPE
jgi:mannosylglycerate hydrolase